MTLPCFGIQAVGVQKAVFLKAQPSGFYWIWVFFRFIVGVFG